MKTLFLSTAFLMLSSITNKVFSQTTTTDSEATIISVNADKMSGTAYYAETGEIIEFINGILVDLVPNDKVLVTITESIANRKVGRITFKAKEGATMIIVDGEPKQISTAEGPRY